MFLHKPVLENSHYSQYFIYLTVLMSSTVHTQISCFGYNIVTFGEMIKPAVGLNVEPLGWWADRLHLRWSKWSGLHEKATIPISPWKARQGNSTWSISAKCNGTWTHRVAGKHTGALAGAPLRSGRTEQQASHIEKAHMGHNNASVLGGDYETVQF